MMILSSAVRAAALNSCVQEDSFGCSGNSCCSKGHCGLLQGIRLGGLGQ